MQGIEEYQGPLAAFGAWWNPASWPWFRSAPTPAPTFSRLVTRAPTPVAPAPSRILPPPPPPKPVAPPGPASGAFPSWWRDEDAIPVVQAAIAYDPAHKDEIVKYVSGAGPGRDRSEQIAAYYRSNRTLGNAQLAARKMLVPGGKAAPWVRDNRNAVQEDYFHTRLVNLGTIYASNLGGAGISIMGDGTSEAGFFGKANASWSYLDPDAAGITGRDIPFRGTGMPRGEQWFVNITAKGRGMWKVVRGGRTYTAPLGIWEEKPPASRLSGFLPAGAPPAAWIGLAVVGYLVWKAHTRHGA